MPPQTDEKLGEIVPTRLDTEMPHRVYDINCRAIERSSDGIGAEWIGWEMTDIRCFVLPLRQGFEELGSLRPRHSFYPEPLDSV